MKMKIEFKEGIFASMKYLDAEIERYKDGYPNPKTRLYYETLKKIRDIQNSGVVPSDEIYKNLAKPRNKKALEIVEYGYYISNIHYYLYDSCSEYEKTDSYKDTLNYRILYFLKTASKEALYPYDWFLPNFVIAYLNFLADYYDIQIESNHSESLSDSVSSLSEFVNKYGNKTEKEIMDLIISF